MKGTVPSLHFQATFTCPSTAPALSLACSPTRTTQRKETQPDKTSHLTSIPARARTSFNNQGYEACPVLLPSSLLSPSPPQVHRHPPKLPNMCFGPSPRHRRHWGPPPRPVVVVAAPHHRMRGPPPRMGMGGGRMHHGPPPPPPVHMGGRMGPPPRGRRW